MSKKEDLGWRDPLGGIRFVGDLVQMGGENEPSPTSKRKEKVNGLIKWQTSNLDSALLGLKERAQRIKP